MDRLVEVKNLKMYFGDLEKKDSKNVLHAVDDVSFYINENEFFGLVGESGCGKSTLGRCLIGLNKKTDGEVNISADSKNASQMIFQNPFSSLNPRKTIKKTLMEVIKVNHLYKGEEEDKIVEMLDFVGLNKESLYKYPNQFSGGQLQRIAIARALLLNPKFVVADEPVSALDVSVQAQILNLFSDLKKELSLTMLFISHNLSVVEYICDRIAVMYLGKIVEIADAKELYHGAVHPYTKSLISAIPVPKVSDDTSFYDGILAGEIPNPMDIPKGCRFASRCKYKTEKCEECEPELEIIDETAGHMVACHNWM